MPDLRIRQATDTDVPALARIWYDGWQDAHAALLPAELRRARTQESFVQRLTGAIADVRLADRGGGALGFAMCKNDELDQFYVAAAARGTDVAPALMRDALARLRTAGFSSAWLACAIGNVRAARFYEKCGWRLARTMTSHLPTPAGVFTLDVWRYEISLATPPSRPSAPPRSA